MLISFKFMLAYVLGGLTLIPLTVLFLYTSFVVYSQIYKPLVSLFRLYLTSATIRKSNIQKQLVYTDKDDMTAPPFEKPFAEETHNDDMAHSQSAAAPSIPPLYKVGWLKVLTQEDQSLLSMSIGVIVKNYISTSMSKQRGGDSNSLTGNSSSNNDNHMYFSVLKDNTLYLYDSEKQLDCKGVINLSQYSVQMHPPGLQDFELYSKPNLIKLQPKENEVAAATAAMTATNSSTTTTTHTTSSTESKSSTSTKQELSYFINCNKCIDKEDWYFALLRATNTTSTTDKTHFEQAAMNDLLKTAYSNEHNFHTQWFNALLGRIFLGIYRTEDIKHVLYRKVLTKLDKINAKRPPFLGEITVRSVDPGHGIPAITQPKLLNLSPTGDLSAEAYLHYQGEFRIEIETVLVWKYFDRMKPLTIDLVLGITLKEIKGKVMIKIKEPPTNRFWYGFYECPQMEWKVEPVVWEKRVGYSVVVKAIETKIQELIVETMVIPHFDDITFFPTDDGLGGIFEKKPPETEKSAPDDQKKKATNAATRELKDSCLSVKSAPVPIIDNNNKRRDDKQTATGHNNTSISNKKLKKEERQQQKVKDEALITTARSLPELFSSAVPDRTQHEQCRASQDTAKSSTKLFEPTKKPPIRQQPSYTVESIISSDSSTTTTTTTTSSSSEDNNPNLLLLANTSSLSTSPNDSYLSSSPGSLTADERTGTNIGLLSRMLTATTTAGIAEDTHTLGSTATVSQLIVTPSNSTSLLGTSSEISTSTVHIAYSEIDENEEDSQDKDGKDIDGKNEKRQPQQRRIKKQSSLALLRPKTVASTAIDVSPAMRL